MLKVEREQRLEPLLLTPREVCALLRIGRTTLWELRRKGLLQTIYVGRSPRFRREDVEELVEKLAAGVSNPLE
ncbi:helix-turn-helix domain-containing protein [Rhodothermus marinus]|uniref:helix-turn-helix domain-containing protein n=1 Tax=Rhodothermus marinus TaxID=29549 RepID=UPI0006D2A105|nr:helix-turn-helix domain-containing protein [Rhodothermus marinus]